MLLCAAGHLGKDGVFIYGSVLDPSPALPDDLLVLLKPSVQQKHLNGRQHTLLYKTNFIAPHTHSTLTVHT